MIDFEGQCAMDVCSDPPGHRVGGITPSAAPDEVLVSPDVGKLTRVDKHTSHRHRGYGADIRMDSSRYSFHLPCRFKMRF